MNTEAFKIRILVIDNDFSEVEDLKSRLERDMRLPWSMSHCVNVEESTPRIHKADLIILKPQMEGGFSPNHVFRRIEGMAYEIPILVLTNDYDEQGFSTFVMEKGAADTVVRGQFARLVDAIEFALIRQKLTTGKRKAAEQELSNRKDKDDEAELQRRDENSFSDQDRHKQILRMLGGDYAVEKQD